MADNFRLFPGLSLYKKEGREFTTGVFPSQLIRHYIERGRITATSPIQEEQIQPASLDVRLGNTAYEVSASVIPGRHNTVLEKLDSVDPVAHDLREPTTLEVGHVYVVPLQERLRLPAEVSARANPKSTTGRLDIFVRCLADYTTGFNSVAGGYTGPLYVEIVPHSFPIIVQSGVSLNQIRFVRGNPPSPDSELHELNDRDMLLYTDKEDEDVRIRRGLHLSVRGQGDVTGEVVGYRARKNTEPVDIRAQARYDPASYWEELASSSAGIVLHPDNFYLLASREWIRVPPQYAAEMQAYDPQVGEFRVHYAGFLDPGFGFGHGEVQGARAVLEVRPHKVPFLMEDGQVIGRVKYERLMAVPDKVYSVSIGSSYQGQGLSLSKQFK